MENFSYYNPTKIIFGKNEVDRIGSEAALIGKKAIVLIGKGSAKKTGLYARVISSLNMYSIKSVTYEGIKSNPLYQDADEAVLLAKEFGADMVIAIGGGSVIDTAKAVAMGVYVEHSVWDFYLQKAKPEKALPLLNILTLAATGTEMNSSTVLQDTESGMKKGYSAPVLFPKLSILDPTLTYTVPATYTAYGIADLIAHCLEVYFGKGEAPLSDHYIASILKLATVYGPKVIENPEDYDARANIMWLATNALNGSLVNGKGNGDWGSHLYEHTLSVLYDVAHGAGLSIVFPAWMKHFAPKFQGKLAFLAKMVFDVNEGSEEHQAEQFIVKLEAFFKQIHTPVRLAEVGILKADKAKILENLQQNKVSGRVYAMKEEDHELILEKMW
jgi:alcohol dehydrogenase YqhD (iron-dependent ADH family)